MNIISFLDLYNSQSNFEKNLNVELEKNIKNSFILAYVDIIDSRYLINSSTHNLLFKSLNNLDLDNCEVIPADLMLKANEELLTLMSIVNRFSFSSSKSSSFSEILKSSYKFLESCYFLIKKNHIDVIIFFDIPHTPLEYSYYILAKHLNINIIFFNFLPMINGLPEICFLSDELGTIPNFKIQKTEDYNTDQKSNYKLDNYSTVIYLTYLNKLGSKMKLFIKKVFSYIIARRFDRLIARIGNLIYMKTFYRPALRLVKLFHEQKIELDSLKYLYYPLHYQPEATTLPSGGIYSNQEYLVRILSALIPEDMYLVVKEHPAYKMSGAFDDFSKYRDLGIYKRLSKLRNVKLIKSSTPTADLIEKSFGVVTITGTVAWEALISNKYCMIFGKTYYTYLPNSLKCSNEDEINSAIKIMRKKKSNFQNELGLFLDQIVSIGTPALRHPDRILSTKTKLNEEKSRSNILMLLLKKLNSYSTT